jgi:iron complex outermembrane receptor protein
LEYSASFGWRTDQYRTIFNSIDFLYPDNPRLRLNDEVEGFWTVDAGAAFVHQNGKLRVEGYVTNVTGDVHEAAMIITQFDNTRFFTRPRLAGVRVSYRFGG